MKTKEVKLPVSAAEISISEAYDLLIEAKKIDDTIQEYQAKGLELPIGKMIAANMLGQSGHRTLLKIVYDPRKKRRHAYRPQAR